MTDFADLTLRIDSTQVKAGVDELDKLTQAGDRAEQSTKALASASTEAKQQAFAWLAEVKAGTLSQQQFAERMAASTKNLDALRDAQRSAEGDLKALRVEAEKAGQGIKAATTQAATATEKLVPSLKSASAAAADFAANARRMADANTRAVANTKQFFAATTVSATSIGQMASAGKQAVPAMASLSSGVAATTVASRALSSTVGTLANVISGSLMGIVAGAASALVSMAIAHFKADDAAKAQAEAAEDLRKAIDDLHASTVQETRSAYAAAEASIAVALSYQTRAREARKAAIAEYELAKAAGEKARAVAGPGQVGFGSGGSIQIGNTNAEAARLESKAKELDGQIAKLNAQIGKTDSTIRLQQGQIISMKLEEAFDKGAAATGKFGRTMDGLNKELAAGKITLDDYAAKTLSAMQTRETETETTKKSTKAHRERKAALTDEQRAYQQALKATDSYIASLALEIEKIGKTPAQIRQIEIARAKEGAATDAQRAKIDLLNVAREKSLAIAEAEAKAKDRKKNDAQLVEPLTRELALLGMVGEARDKAALKLEFESKKAQMVAGDLNISVTALQAWYDTSLKIIEGESALDREDQAARNLLDALSLVAEQSQVTADIMGGAFGKVGDVFGSLLANIADYSAQRATLDKQIADKQISRANADKVLATLEVKNTAQAIHGVKSLFKEKSTAYKVLTAIEMAYAALQVVNTIKSIALDATKTSSSVANSGVRAAADGVAAVAKAIASLPFPLNLAAGAATAAALIAFGVKMFGGGGGGGGVPDFSTPTAEELQESAGTGTVLGDAAAKSASIANSLALVAENTNSDLEYSNQMLKALRSIDLGIAKMAGTVAEQIQVAGSLFDTGSLRLGSSGSSGFLGISSKNLTRELYDLGIQLTTATVGAIVQNGIHGITYQIVQETKQKKGLFGGKTEVDLDTYRGALPTDIASAIQDVIMGLRDGLVAAADVIGLEGAEAILNSFQVNLGKISFKGMTGEEIESQLNAIFSSVGDQMATKLLPSLSSLQLVGEGLFETFMRVAKEYQAVDTAMKSLGRTFGATGIESIAMRDHLVQLFGGLDEFLESTNTFRDQFLTEAEQMAPIAAAVRAEMVRLGMAGITTRDQFKQAVLGLDLTTTAGREMYASLLAVAPAFDKVLDYVEQLNKAQIDSLQKTVDQFTKFAESLKKYRETLFQTDAAQGNAYNRLRSQFMSTADLAATGDATALGGLENAGKAFLDAARNNAGTREQYLRDVAMVARGVDKGIFAAEETADYAQLQLDALENAVGILTQISTNTAAAAAALGAPTPGSVAAPVGPTAPVPVPAGAAPAASTPSGKDTSVAAMQRTVNEEMRPALEAMTSHLAEMNRRWNRMEENGALAVVTREGDTVDTNLASWGA